jgi:hypothetical protein
MNSFNSEIFAFFALDTWGAFQDNQHLKHTLPLDSFEAEKPSNNTHLVTNRNQSKSNITSSQNPKRME